MTSKEFQAILKNHKLWVESGCKQGNRANLLGANLEGANLSRANLEGANLRGAYLKGANLLGANLIGANLLRANLQGAILSRANLRGAYLKGANLRGASLYKANLLGASLSRANLNGAILEGADLQGTELSARVWEVGKLYQLCSEFGFWNGENLYRFPEGSNILGMLLQINEETNTFDLLLTNGDIARNIPSWVKHTHILDMETEALLDTAKHL